MKPSTYCKNCGAYIPDGKKKCLACGFPVDVPSLGEDINKVETTTFQECSPNRLSFKPFENYTPDGRYFWNGYEINENGQVLSIPDDDEDDIPMTSLDDKTLNIAHSVRRTKLEIAKQMYESRRQPKKPVIDKQTNITSQVERFDLKPIEQRLNDYEAVCDKYAEMVFQDDYYRHVLEAANKVRQNIEQSKSKQQEPKPDIDLDDLMEKTFVTVKINDKVTRFYFGDRPQMCVYDSEILGRTLDGRIIGNGIKRKIDFRLVET